MTKASSRRSIPSVVSHLCLLLDASEIECDGPTGGKQGFANLSASLDNADITTNPCDFTGGKRKRFTHLSCSTDSVEDRRHGTTTKKRVSVVCESNIETQSRRYGPPVEHEVTSHCRAETETEPVQVRRTIRPCKYAELLQASQCHYQNAFLSDLGSTWGSYEPCKAPNPSAVFKQ